LRFGRAAPCLLNNGFSRKIASSSAHNAL
jgi:hypothetical protein